MPCSFFATFELIRTRDLLTMGPQAGRVYAFGVAAWLLGTLFFVLFPQIATTSKRVTWHALGEGKQRQQRPFCHLFFARSHFMLSPGIPR